VIYTGDVIASDTALASTMNRSNFPPMSPRASLDSTSRRVFQVDPNNISLKLPSTGSTNVTIKQSSNETSGQVVFDPSPDIPTERRGNASSHRGTHVIPGFSQTVFNGNTVIRQTIGNVSFTGNHSDVHYGTSLNGEGFFGVQVRSGPGNSYNQSRFRQYGYQEPTPLVAPSTPHSVTIHVPPEQAHIGEVDLYGRGIVFEAPHDLPIGSLRVATHGGQSDLGGTKADRSRITLEGNSCVMDATKLRTNNLRAVMSGGNLSLPPAEKTLIHMNKGTLHSEVPDTRTARYDLLNTKGDAYIKLPKNYKGEFVSNGPGCSEDGKLLDEMYMREATNER
jgi:hypothetical protein